MNNFKKFMKNIITIGLVALTIMSLAEVLDNTFNKIIELVKSVVDYFNCNIMYILLIALCIFMIDRINGRFITKKIYRLIY